MNIRPSAAIPFGHLASPSLIQAYTACRFSAVICQNGYLIIPGVLCLLRTIFILSGISKFQAVWIQKKILHSHDDKSFFISPRFCRSAYNHYFLKGIWNITQRTKFLRLLFL